MAWRAWVPDEPLQPWRALAVGAALGVAASLVRLAVAEPLARELPFITFFPALIVAGVSGGLLGGGACLVVATAAALALFMPRGSSPVWALASFWISAGLVTVVAAGMADSVRAHRRSRAQFMHTESRLQTLVAELAHRNRNALAVIMALVDQSARSAATGAQAAEIVNGRLAALARAQDVILRARGEPALLRDLIEQALEPFGLHRFELAAGPQIRVSEDVASALGLLFHELATNALKHGALSAPEGRVRVSSMAEDAAHRILWREMGGPAVAEPSHKGFGSRLLDVVLVQQGGRAQRRFEPAGVVCEIWVPALPRSEPSQLGL